MSRQRRINAPGTIHHVVNRGANRQALFYVDADRVECGRLIGEIHERFGITVIAYCLMDNHFHLILHCVEGHLSLAMHHLQSVLASHVNGRHGRDGPLFKGRFYSALIDTDQYLVTATRYVERNPLAIHGVDDPAAYRWSSARARLGLKASPIWLETNRMLDYFPDTEAYADFLRATPTVEQPQTIRTDHLDDLARLMVTLFADDDVRTAQIERTVIAAVSRSMSESNQRLVASHLGFTDLSAFRRAARRAERRVDSEPSLATVIDELRLRIYDSSSLEAPRRPAA